MTQPTNTFRPHAVSCWTDAQTIEPIRSCADQHGLPLGTVIRIVVSGVLANDERRNDVIGEAATAQPMSKVGRAMIAAMVDDSTQAALSTIAAQTGTHRANVIRASLVVGAKHIVNFSHELDDEREARQAAQARNHERMIKMVKRFQGEVVA